MRQHPKRVAIVKPRVKTCIEIRYGIRGALIPALRRKRMWNRIRRRRREPAMRWRAGNEMLPWYRSLLADAGFMNADNRTGLKCDTPHCRNHGTGPMLRTVVWKSTFARRGAALLCEPCMLPVLGRPIAGIMLRDCRMNYWHPYYKTHGRN